MHAANVHFAPNWNSAQRLYTVVSKLEYSVTFRQFPRTAAPLRFRLDTYHQAKAAGIVSNPVLFVYTKFNISGCLEVHQLFLTVNRAL